MMASQTSEFPPINFSITTPFKNVRLIEVTDEILEVIASRRKDGEGGSVGLRFKSSPPPAVTTTLSGNYATSKSKDSVLHLCSNDKAWAVKQVSTSNSVYVIAPISADDVAKSLDVSGDTIMNDDGTTTQTDSEVTIAAQGNVSAIAKIGNFLELQPAKIDETEIEEAILQLVPTYYLPLDSDDETLRPPQRQEPISFDSLLADIPAPDSVIRRVCSRLCLFESSSDESQTRCYIPSTPALLNTWSKMIEGCSIESVKLDGNIPVERTISVLDDETDRAITEAMLKEGGMLDVLDLTESISNSDSPSSRKFRAKETAVFIADLNLKTRLSQPKTPPAIETESFLRKWSDILPTSFVKHCTLDNLSSSDLVTISKDSDGVESITFKEHLIGSSNTNAVGVSSTSSSMNSATKTPTSTAPASAAKRKWHEKFGAQRSAKK